MAKGFAEEKNDRPYLVVDGLDGRGHYVVLSSNTDLGALAVGGIVDVRPTPPSVADRNVAARAVDGTYRTADHLRDLQMRTPNQANAKDILSGHVRRLEALRRAGVVERVEDGVWRVPSDLVARGAGYDSDRLGNVSVELKCHMPIEPQVRVIGATWLDQQLVDGAPISQTSVGFGAATRQALVQRLEFLIEQGFVERRNQETSVREIF